MKIKKGDKVLIIAGRHRGKTGVVEAVSPTNFQVKVAGVGLAKRHTRKNAATGRSGGVTEVHKGIHVSNVMLVSPTNDKPTRVSYQGVKKDKVRIAKTTGDVLK